MEDVRINGLHKQQIDVRELFCISYFSFQTFLISSSSLEKVTKPCISFIGLGLPIQRALTLPSSTEESQALLDVNFSDGNNQNLGTGNLKDICLIMKSPMRVTPPSFPTTIEDDVGIMFLIKIIPESYQNILKCLK